MMPSTPLDAPLPGICPPAALSFDLDDTLWPIWPTIAKAEAHLFAWLALHAPATAARFDAKALRAIRNEVGEQHPEQGHDLSWLRRESVRRALVACGDDPALAEPAFDEFFAVRQQVDLYPDVADGLQRLARRFRMIAVTNGNSDLAQVGLSGFFSDTVSAQQVGVAKPDPRIFHEACRRLALPPADVLHIGDDLLTDVAGALDAGLQAVWIRRVPEDAAAPAPRCPVFHDLHALADALGC